MIEKLGKYYNVISGFAFKSSDLKDNADIPIIKIGNISNGKNVIIENMQYVDHEFLNINEKYHIKNGDVLISLTGSHINQPNSMVGRVCRNYDKQTYLLNQRAGKIIAKENASTDYMFYALLTKAMKESIVSRAYGAANQVNVSPAAIMGIKWNFPTLPIQKKIASILSAYDCLIENNTRRIRLLEQMAENLYKEWFVRFRFPEHEKVEMVNGLPKGWKIKRIADFGRIETGKTPPMSNRKLYGGDILFVKTPDMHDKMFISSTSETLSEDGNNYQLTKLLPANSIMVSCIGTAGIVSINAKPAHTNQQINSIILNNLEDLEWLYYVCKQMKPTIELFGATGATMTNLSKGKFEKLKVVVPKANIRESFHKRIRPYFKEIFTLDQQNTLLTRQRDLLLPRLMSGKLEVKS